MRRTTGFLPLLLALALSAFLTGCPSSDLGEGGVDTGTLSDVALADSVGGDAAGGDGDAGTAVHPDGEAPGPVDAGGPPRTDTVLPPLCCETDDDCEEGRVCEGFNEASGTIGECRLVPEDGCWRDTHCGDGESCLGAMPCGCNVDCYWSGPGVCVWSGSTCCFLNEDCGPGLRCVGGQLGGAPGHCKPEAAEGFCWGDADCAAGAVCDGLQLCPCDALCDMEDVPGRCRVLGGCCDAADDCLDGETCIGLGIGPPGNCVPTPEAGTCYERGQCGPDQDCVGGRPTNCMMSSLPNLGQCTDLPDHCCWDDGDCGADRTCEGADELGWGAGECLLVPEAGQCYRDTQCPTGTQCQGAGACGCFVDCDSAGPGQCTPLRGICCFEDSDCGEGLRCVDGERGGAVGQCKPEAAPGTCWGDEDCGDWYVCEGEQLCPCDADCDMEDLPGTCAPIEGCCDTDADCGDGFSCADYPAGDMRPGACKPAQPEGMCWDQDDCGEGTICAGANPCPCGMESVGDGCDIPGTCEPWPNGCCTVDSDCGDGKVCTPDRVCVPAPNFGQCWSDDDCYPTQECTGATYCPCGVECGQIQAPGSCTPLPLGCCYDDSGCDEGFVCRATGSGDNLPGRCVPDPAGPACIGDTACCWENADCGPNESCGDVYVCGCIALCHVCGDCADDRMGFCE